MSVLSISRVLCLSHQIQKYIIPFAAVYRRPDELPQGRRLSKRQLPGCVRSRLSKAAPGSNVESQEKNHWPEPFLKLANARNRVWYKLFYLLRQEHLRSRFDKLVRENRFLDKCCVFMLKQSLFVYEGFGANPDLWRVNAQQIARLQLTVGRRISSPRERGKS